MSGPSAGSGNADAATGHRRWVRLTHWLIALAVIVLMFSGVAILMAHPRLYWGTAGNDLTRPLLSLPIGPNGGGAQFAPGTRFFAGPDSPVTANRLVEPWNANAWARSLHFLAAWVFLAGLAVYLAIGAVTGHARRDLIPRRRELSPANVRQDVAAHIGLSIPQTSPGPPYSILQKLAYALISFVALPLMFLTGVTMSPAISAGYPLLLDLFGGTQSARTIHFFCFTFIALFVAVHLIMVLLTGPGQQLRGMTIGTRR